MVFSIDEWMRRCDWDQTSQTSHQTYCWAIHRWRSAILCHPILLTNELLFQKQSINSIEMTHKRDKTFLIIQTFGHTMPSLVKTCFISASIAIFQKQKKVSNLWKLIERRFHSTSFELRPEKHLKSVIKSNLFQFNSIQRIAVFCH